jgi:hypothetical protein
MIRQSRVGVEVEDALGSGVIVAVILINVAVAVAVDVLTSGVWVCAGVIRSMKEVSVGLRASRKDGLPLAMPPGRQRSFGKRQGKIPSTGEPGTDRTSCLYCNSL